VVISQNPNQWRRILRPCKGPFGLVLKGLYQHILRHLCQVIALPVIRKSSTHPSHPASTWTPQATTLQSLHTMCRRQAEPTRSVD
jgi:hypothetical protein